jgi:metal-sulfur cluster biosynthetic enzyme
MTVSTGDVVENMVRDALRIVIDPEIGRSVVDIGLIYNIEAVEDGSIVIDMTTTTEGCPAAGYLVEAVRRSILGAALSKSVVVRLVYDPPWSSDMMVE